MAPKGLHIVIFMDIMNEMGENGRLLHMGINITQIIYIHHSFCLLPDEQSVSNG